jgi:hypothetical protein
MTASIKDDKYSCQRQEGDGINRIRRTIQPIVANLLPPSVFASGKAEIPVAFMKGEKMKKYLQCHHSLRPFLAMTAIFIALYFVLCTSYSFAAKVCKKEGHMAGAVMAFAAGTAPEGFLLCDGAAVGRAQYAHLFAAIGTAYGDGDGSTTFNLPDMRDAFIRGAGGSNGAALGTRQMDAAPNITGYVHEIVLRKTGGQGGALWKSGGSANADVAGTDGANGGYRNISIDASRSSASYGRDGATEVRPTNYSMHYYIKY